VLDEVQTVLQLFLDDLIHHLNRTLVLAD